jgi:GNAT superfamily N-acetyltransferase
MFNTRLEKYQFIISNLGVWVPAKFFLKRFLYLDYFYFLTVPLKKVGAGIRIGPDIQIAEARNEDWMMIVDGLKQLDDNERREIVVRLLFYLKGFHGCYIGRNESGDIVSLQWLIRPRDNPLIEKHFNDFFYPLNEKQVMVENIFVYPEYRGLGVFTTVNHLLLEKAREEGFVHCLAYIHKGNITSLNGFMKLGFQVKKLLRSYNLCGFSWRNL